MATSYYLKLYQRKEIQLLNTVLGGIVHGHLLEEQERKILVHK